MIFRISIRSKFIADKAYLLQVLWIDFRYYVQVLVGTLSQEREEVFKRFFNLSKPFLSHFYEIIVDHYWENLICQNYRQSSRIIDNFQDNLLKVFKRLLIVNDLSNKMIYLIFCFCFGFCVFGPPLLFFLTHNTSKSLCLGVWGAC